MLKWVHERLYAYNAGNGIRYLLTKEDAGVYCYGKAWFLRMIENGHKIFLGKWVMKSDGDGLEKEGVGQRIWEYEDKIVEDADRVIMDLN